VEGEDAIHYILDCLLQPRLVPSALSAGLAPAGCSMRVAFYDNGRSWPCTSADPTVDG
jgi:hypothetical protein